MKIHFNKYHGCGNDFIIIDNTDSSIHLTKETIKALCSRHTGIGADGLILVEDRDNHYYMNYYNADGTHAEMCGNGLRCTSHFIYHHLDNSSNIFTVGSPIGDSEVKVYENDYVRVTLPKASFAPQDIGIISKEPIINLPTLINGRMYRVGYASMGNPHLVIFGERTEELALKRIGPEYEVENGTNKPINVSLTKIYNKDHISVKTWERGVGETLACGTGACASVSILNENGLINKKVIVSLPGGDIQVDLEGDTYLKMTGPATEVYSGEVDL